MAERGIEVVLVHTKYNMKGKVSDAQLPLTDIVEAEPSEYPAYINVGEWSDGGHLRFCPHLQVKKGGRYENADIAVKAPIGQAECIEAVTTEPKGDAYQRYEDKEADSVYFIPPRYWEYRYGKPNEISVNHYNTIGSEEIRIRFTDGRTESMILISKIMEEEEDFLRELVSDLIAMDQKLCTDRKSSMSMAIQWTKDLYEETKKMTEDFCSAFRGLEKAAQPALKPFKEKKPFHKIKKMSSQALIEHEIFRKDKVSAIAYKEDFDTFEHRVVRTYLERLKSLIRVRSRMEVSELEKKRAGLEMDLQFGREELADRIRGVEKELEQKKARLETLLDGGFEEQDSKELLTVCIRFRIGSGFRGKDGKNGLMGFRVQKSRGQNQERLVIQIGPWHPDIRKQQITYIDCNGRIDRCKVSGVQDGRTSGCKALRLQDGRIGGYKVPEVRNSRTCGYKVLGKDGRWPDSWAEYSVPDAGQTKLIYISVPADCTEAASVLFHYLQSGQCIVRENDFVGIYGDIVKEGYCKKGDRFAEFHFDFRRIKGIALYDSKDFYLSDETKETYLVKDLSEEEKCRFREEFREYVLHNVELSGYETEDLAFYKAVEKKQELIDELDVALKDEEKLKEKWIWLENRLDQIGRSRLMKAVTPARTPVRTSNLFAFHPAYQKMYGVMTADGHKMGEIDYYAKEPDEMFQVGKLEELYEVWCFLRLLEIFIDDYGFRLTNGPGSIKEYIREALKGGVLSGMECNLEGDVSGGAGAEKMWVTISYEERIPLDKEYLRQNHFFACDRRGKPRERASLTPDFVIRMSMGGETRVFVLDAKYRGRGYDGIQDLCEVAFQKYTSELGNRRKRLISEGGGLFGEEIDGSFIIHSSSDTVENTFPCTFNGKEIEVKYHPQNYLGAFPDVLARELWTGRCRDKGWLIALDKFQEWVEWAKNEDSHENRIGVVAANPGKKKGHLSNLLQMIMEHYFGLYRSRCWICGSSHTEVELKYTESGYPKYYIKCLDCGEVTVETHCINRDCHRKLGKHMVNYYAQMKGRGRDVWKNVACPACRATLSSQHGRQYNPT
ncbi:MAG: hypothetical protein K1W22_11575 [Lachnospiraceae bacterium]